MGRPRVRITVDTNILVRAMVRDDVREAEAAAAILKDAEVIAVSSACLCELVWVLRQVYGLRQHDVSSAIAALLNAGNVLVDRPAADAGLAVLAAGGDFADGLIAHEGAWLGGETFVSFDNRAVTLIARQGRPAILLA